jgi:hypothetical protein
MDGDSTSSSSLLLQLEPEEEKFRENRTKKILVSQFRIGLCRRRLDLLQGDCHTVAILHFYHSVSNSHAVSAVYGEGGTKLYLYILFIYLFRRFIHLIHKQHLYSRPSKQDNSSSKKRISNDNPGVAWPSFHLIQHHAPPTETSIN